MPSFQDPDIQQASLSFYCSSLAGIDNYDVERPLKRARLATVNDDQTVNDVRSNIVCKIYSFLGLEVNMALDGLSKNVAYATTLRVSIWRC